MPTSLSTVAIVPSFVTVVGCCRGAETTKRRKLLRTAAEIIHHGTALSCFTSPPTWSPICTLSCWNAVVCTVTCRNRGRAKDSADGSIGIVESYPRPRETFANAKLGNLVFLWLALLLLLLCAAASCAMKADWRGLCFAACLSLYSV